MKFEQHWPGGFRGKAIEIINIFSIQMYGAHTNAYRSKLQRTTILLAILVDLPSPMIPAKVQPQGILGSGGEDF